MKMPPLLGNLNQSNFFIYTACDVEYFDEFGPALINSVLKNTQHGIHLHLYNPRPDQVAYCRNLDRVSVTYEDAPIDLFQESAQRWQTVPADPVLADQHRRILTAMSKSNDTSIQQRIQRTYFACARFVRLSELIMPTTQVFAIDADAIVRRTLPLLDNQKDFYIHYISGKRARFLAGGLYLNSNNGYDFLKRYAGILKSNIENNNLHWGIDQDVLPDLVTKYHWGDLPMEYIDWEMQERSYIWTAKGTRKNLQIFINEKNQYKS
jgi:hypothetical protein